MSFLSKIFGRRIDANLEDALVAADVAPAVAVVLAKSKDEKELREKLLKYAKRLEPDACSLIPNTLLIVGANGAGKTTTIGKLAARWSAEGRRVVIGAGDTFRAAANEQLESWAARAGALVIRGTEPAAVAYKTISEIVPTQDFPGGEAARKIYPAPTSGGRKSVAIIDTAGRLHNRADLMEELSKIVRVMKKVDAGAPSATWLVLDGSHGQNALSQIEFFDKAAPLTGLVITKMDGTGRAGFLISYAAESTRPLPVVWIGSGEKTEDLRPFSAADFVDRILSE